MRIFAFYFGLGAGLVTAGILLLDAVLWVLPSLVFIAFAACIVGLASGTIGAVALADRG
jgi:hypothetical protein